jgi:hypothetical protein
MFFELFSESTRKRALLLVSQAYSSICIEDFSASVGVPSSEAAKCKCDSFSLC